MTLVADNKCLEGLLEMPAVHAVGYCNLGPTSLAAAKASPNNYVR
jgi:hypothetical protein